MKKFLYVLALIMLLTPFTNVEVAAAQAKQATVQTTQSKYELVDTAELTLYAKSSSNIRSLPDTKGAKLMSVPKNAKIVTKGITENGWYLIKSVDDIEAIQDMYIKASLLKSTAPTSTAVPAPNTVSTAPSASNTVSQAQNDTQNITVYVTKTGKKYHRNGCQYLKQSKIEMSLSEAKKVYEPCKVCKP